jgi:hypothetical protein
MTPQLAWLLFGVVFFGLLIVADRVLAWKLKKIRKRIAELDREIAEIGRQREELLAQEPPKEGA